MIGSILMRKPTPAVLRIQAPRRALRFAGFAILAATLPAMSNAQARVQSYAFSHGTGFTSGGGVRVGVSLGQSMAGFGQSDESAGGAGFWYTTRERLVPVGTESDLPDGIPKDFELQPNYPNPFNPTTRIRYGVPKAAFVRIGVYNALGQRVAELVSAEKVAGYYEVEWDGRTLGGGHAPSGIYFYRFDAGSFKQSRSMVLQK
ncbi:MAG TPA: FlgD immunoglobulin-like domain containing protein [Rhodothermales bacterium]|nr:FlgD immunoglobulin-like domain containing protein [Rhodothermales bacterium]